MVHAEGVTVGNVVNLRQAEPERRAAPAVRRGRRSFGKLRRLPSGRWQASYVAPDGRRRTAPTTFDTKGDASTWLAMRQSEIAEHRWRPAPPPADTTTLGEYAEGWLAGRQLKPRTRAEYRRIMDAKILPGLADRRLTGLTVADVRAWYGTLDPGTPTARAHAYGLLRTICAAAVAEERIAANPCRIAGAGTTRRATTTRPATAAEIDAIADAMPARYRLAVRLSAYCALRFGELTELRRADIDPAGGVIRVRRAVTWPGGVATVGTPKSRAGIRDVHVPPNLWPAVAAHLAAHVGPGADALVFPNSTGQHLHHGSLYKVFKPARAKAGRPDLRWHDLRHTGATLAARAGATLPEVMARLGHSTVAAALVYQHASAERDAELARRIAAMTGGTE